MDCPMMDGAVAGLPDDPLVEILSRVPVKSLCRFKCVCKGWRDLISTPLYRRKFPQTLEGFFYGSRRRHFEIRSGDGGDVGDRSGGDGGSGGCRQCLDYVFIDLMGRSVPLVDPSFSFLTQELPGLEHIGILHSCNGLLLLRHGPDPHIETLGYVVCNPATEEWVSVSSSGSPEGGDEDNESYRREYNFLIFDPAVSSHFRLLQFLEKASSILKEVGLRTYSSETGVWTDRSGERRRLEEGGESLHLCSFGSISSSLGSAFVNGMLHFAAYHIQKEQQLIVAVDWEGKTRRVINWPQFHGCSWSEPAFVGQSQGRLCCISEQIEHNSGQITISVLEEYDKEKWVMKDRVSLGSLEVSDGLSNLTTSWSPFIQIAI